MKYNNLSFSRDVDRDVYDLKKPRPIKKTTIQMVLDKHNFINLTEEEKQVLQDNDYII